MKDIENLGGTITHVYDTVLKGFAALVSTDLLAAVHSLAGNGAVDYVENDGQVSIQGF
ncbi:hypothetical protein DL96DRAFT_1603313 [Flagelloscypha sp. PMI_526]|nr:hypothetical protein DL96DRAFT_1603313 [Flagelloscypha sp. PMI_526]